tara:strand:+ start:428 stop:625 length:198 start_codon:yes stop_codon:yes gene_type:complete
MHIRHNYDAPNLRYNKHRVEALETELGREKTRSRRFKKVAKGLYNKIEKLKIENEKLRYEQNEIT